MWHTLQTLLEWCYRAGQEPFDRRIESHNQIFDDPEMYVVNRLKQRGYFATVRIFCFSSSKSSIL